MQHAAHKCQTLAAVAETKLQQQQHRVLVVNFSQLTATFVQYAAFGYFTVGRRGCHTVLGEGGGGADLSPGARHKIKLANSEIFENFGFFLQFLFGNLFYLLLPLLLPLFDGHLSESDATIINSGQKYIATKAKTSWKSGSIIAARSKEFPRGLRLRSPSNWNSAISHSQCEKGGGRSGELSSTGLTWGNAVRFVPYEILRPVNCRCQFLGYL